MVSRAQSHARTQRARILEIILQLHYTMVHINSNFQTKWLSFSYGYRGSLPRKFVGLAHGPCEQWIPKLLSISGMLLIIVYENFVMNGELQRQIWGLAAEKFKLSSFKSSMS